MKEDAPIKTKNVIFMVEDKDLGVCLHCPRLKDLGPFEKNENGEVFISCKSRDGLIAVNSDLHNYRSCPNFSRSVKHDELYPNLYQDNLALLVC